MWHRYQWSILRMHVSKRTYRCEIIEASFSLVWKKLWLSVHQLKDRRKSLNMHFFGKNLRTSIQFNSCAFFSRCSNFFVPVNWHDYNKRDITRTKTFKIIWVYAHWSKHPTNQSYSVTSGLFPVFFSDVENLILENFIAPKDSQ